MADNIGECHIYADIIRLADNKRKPSNKNAIRVHDVEYKIKIFYHR
jgi:hypothetical protein